MIHTGDCIEVMRTLPADSVDAVVTDPPYGLEFMGKGWDAFRLDDPGTQRHRGERAGKQGGLSEGDGNHPARYTSGVSYGGGTRPKTNRCVGCGKRDQFRNPHSCPDGTPWKSELIDPYAAPPSSLAFQNWCRTWALEALRVTRPGGYLLAFGGTRTHHRLVCGLEDAGWIIRDELTWVYASGFPKGKANLKPAHEPIVLARKPGPLRPLGIDAARIPSSDGFEDAWDKPVSTHAGNVVVGNLSGTTERKWVDLSANKPVGGRWPSNLLLSRHEQAWYNLRDGLSPEVAQAIRAYYGAGEGVPALRDDVPRDAIAASESEVLLAGVRGTQPQGGTQDGMGFDRLSGVRQDLRGDAGLDSERAPEVLLPDVLGTVGAGGSEAGSPTHGSGPPEDIGGRKGSERRAEGERLEGRAVDLAGGLHPHDGQPTAEGSAGDRPTDGGGEAVHSGAPHSDGGEDESPAGARRGRASSRRRQGAQPAREPDAGRSDQPRADASDGRARDAASPNAGRRTRGREPSLTLPRELIPDGWLPYFRYSHTRDRGAALFDEPNPYVVGSGAVSDRPPGAQPIERPEGFRRFNGTAYREGTVTGGYTDREYGDTGGYSRFFIVPKSSRADREPVVRGQLPAALKAGYSGGMGEGELSGLDARLRTKTERENAHPTVKPVDLMRHLIRLVTPSGGTVLDCFAGSGSTLIAAELEGFPWIGIEKEPEYVAIAEARLNGTQRGLGLDVGAPVTRRGGKPTGEETGKPRTQYGFKPQTGWFGLDAGDVEPVA